MHTILNVNHAACRVIDIYSSVARFKGPFKCMMCKIDNTTTSMLRSVDLQSTNDPNVLYKVAQGLCNACGIKCNQYDGARIDGDVESNPAKKVGLGKNRKKKPKKQQKSQRAEKIGGKSRRSEKISGKNRRSESDESEEEEEQRPKKKIRALPPGGARLHPEAAAAAAKPPQKQRRQREEEEEERPKKKIRALPPGGARLHPEEGQRRQREEEEKEEERPKKNGSARPPGGARRQREDEKQNKGIVLGEKYVTLEYLLQELAKTGGKERAITMVEDFCMVDGESDAGNVKELVDIVMEDTGVDGLINAGFTLADVRTIAKIVVDQWRIGQRLKVEWKDKRMYQAVCIGFCPSDYTHRVRYDDDGSTEWMVLGPDGPKFEWVE